MQSVNFRGTGKSCDSWKRRRMVGRARWRKTDFLRRQSQKYFRSRRRRYLEAKFIEVSADGIRSHPYNPAWLADVTIPMCAIDLLVAAARTVRKTRPLSDTWNPYSTLPRCT